MKNITIPIVLMIISAHVCQAQCDTIDLALGHPVTASSIESIAFPAANAVDADSTGSRWSSQWSDPQWISVDLGAVFNLCQVKLFWETALGKNFTIDISNDGSVWTSVANINNNTSYQNMISISGSGRYVRMSGISRGTGYGYSLYALKVYGQPGYEGTVDLALGDPVAASSTQSGYPATNAVDGNTGTFGWSNSGDPQTLTVDLGAAQTIGTVSLLMTGNFAKSFDIDLSGNNTTWTTAVAVTSNTAQKIAVNAVGTARYVRFTGLGSAGVGYGIKEMIINGISVILPLSFLSFTATAQSNHQAVLRWSVSSQTSKETYQIERSVNGSDFVSIGNIVSEAETNMSLSYEWKDSLPVIGLNTYRLLETDADGRSVYSDMATLSFVAPAETKLSVYPNPVTDQVTILNPRYLSIRSISLFSADGVRRYSIAPTMLGSVRISLTSLPAGIYFVQAITEEGTSVLPIIKP